MNSISFKKRSLLVEMLSPEYGKSWRQKELQREFFKRDYVFLPEVFSQQAFNLLHDEIDDLEESANSKSFVMPGYETPRVMKTIGGTKILDKSKVLWSLYINHEIRRLVETVAGGNVFPCTHANEFTVINYLEGPGATHGWHLDDPAYALILFFETPDDESGGHVEFIRNWHEICESEGHPADAPVDDLVTKCRRNGMVVSKRHKAGDAYLLRADKCLHRVTEITGAESRRVVVNLGFEATPNTEYGDTASILYDE